MKIAVIGDVPNPNVVYQLMDLGEQVAVTTVEVPYDWQKTEQAILDAGLPEKFCEHHPYRQCLATLLPRLDQTVIKNGTTSLVRLVPVAVSDAFGLWVKVCTLSLQPE